MVWATFLPEESGETTVSRLEQPVISGEFGRCSGRVFFKLFILGIFLLYFNVPSFLKELILLSKDKTLFIQCQRLIHTVYLVIENVYNSIIILCCTDFIKFGRCGLENVYIYIYIFFFEKENVYIRSLYFFI